MYVACISNVPGICINVLTSSLELIPVTMADCHPLPRSPTLTTPQPATADAPCDALPHAPILSKSVPLLPLSTSFSAPAILEQLLNPDHNLPTSAQSYLPHSTLSGGTAIL